MPSHALGNGQHHVLPRGGGDAQLAVRVLADALSVKVSHVAERVEAAQRAHPVAAEAEHVGAATADDTQRVFLAPQALVGAQCHRDALAQLLHVLDRVDPHRRLGEVDTEGIIPRIQHAGSLTHRPRLVCIDADLALGANRVAYRREHFGLGGSLDAYLHIEAGVAATDAVLALATYLLG
jgi:hypothetical protein